MKIVILLGLLSFIYGCTSLNKKECEFASWYGMGLKHGELGRDNKLGDLSRDCAKHSVKVDEDSYMKGYQQGLVKYCTYDNAVKLGKARRSYRNTCENVNDKFSSIYNAYFQFANSQYEISSLKRKINKNESEISSLESQRKSDKYKVLRGGLNSAEMAKLLQKIDADKGRIITLKSENQAMKDRLVFWQTELMSGQSAISKLQR